MDQQTKKNQKTRVLEALQASGIFGITSNMNAELGVKDIPKRICELQDEGYIIDHTEEWVDGVWGKHRQTRYRLV